jgi:hypothetical protein
VLATLAYSPESNVPDDERLHVNLEYKTLKWRLRYSHNGADFYDLFGPTYRSRRGDAVKVGYKDALIYDPPNQLDFVADLAVYRNLDNLPQAQDVAAPSKNLASAQVGLRYVATEKSLGSVDYEKGVRWSLLTAGDMASGDLFPKLYGPSTSARRSRSATPPSGSTTPSASAAGAETTHWPATTSAASATTTSIAAR